MGNSLCFSLPTSSHFQAKKAPVSPLKVKDDISMYENGSLDVRKNRLGHSTLVSMDQNGSPMTTLLRHSSRDGSPASLFRRQEKMAPPSTPAPTTSGDIFDEIPDQMPIMPVLILIVGYLTLGNLS